STRSAAAWICGALVTSRAIGATRASGWAEGRRVPAYTRFAPLLRASATSACPMPRLAPVTRTVLPAIAIAVAPCGCGFRSARLAATNTDEAHPAKWRRAGRRLAAVSGRPSRCPVQALPDPGAGEGAPADPAAVPCCVGRPKEVNRPGSVKAT